MGRGKHQLTSATKSALSRHRRTARRCPLTECNSRLEIRSDHTNLLLPITAFIGTDQRQLDGFRSQSYDGGAATIGLNVVPIECEEAARTISASVREPVLVTATTEVAVRLRWAPREGRRIPSAFRPDWPVRPHAGSPLNACSQSDCFEVRKFAAPGFVISIGKFLGYSIFRARNSAFSRSESGSAVLYGWFQSRRSS
jgi:hypothetical protein